MTGRIAVRRTVSCAEKQADFMPGMRWRQISAGLRMGLFEGTPRTDISVLAESGRHVSLTLVLEGDGHCQMDGVMRACPYSSGCCYLSCAWERFSGTGFFPAYRGLKLAVLQYRTEWLDLFPARIRELPDGVDLFAHPSRRAWMMRIPMSDEQWRTANELLEESIPLHPLHMLKVESKALAALWQVVHDLSYGKIEHRGGLIQPAATMVRRLTGRQRRLLLEARVYIEEHCLESLEVLGIGRAVGLGHNMLKQGFKELFGKSVYNYVLECRLNCALKLLDESTLPVKEVAGRCGFAHASHLARQFRQRYGVSPRTYRRRWCEGCPS